MKNGRIIHTATVNKDKTLTTKNGGYASEQSDATLKSVEREYGTNVTFTDPISDKELTTLKKKGDDRGRAEYSETEVREALKSHNEKRPPGPYREGFQYPKQ